MTILQKFTIENGFKHIELAEKVGTNRSNIHRWVVGETMPSFSYGYRLAKALGISCRQLLTMLEDTDEGNSNILS